jgi:hypothetical protein
MRTKRKEPPWALVAQTARRQGRVVSLAQLRKAGLSTDQVKRARRAGHIHRVHRRVYAVGTRDLDLHGRLWAAHLAVGEDSVIGFASAGQKWAIRPWTGDVHVITPKQRRGHKGVVVHQATVPPGQIRRRNGLPFTNAARTLLDLATILEPEALALALNQALAVNATSLRQLDAILIANPGHHGSGALAQAVQAHKDDPGAGRTRGEMEALFFTLLRDLPSLPPYVRNATLRLAPDYVVSPDALFPEARVWVELDSRRWHEQRLTMDEDRRKDQRGAAFGFLPFRITWRHLVREWEAVSADLLGAVTPRCSTSRA